jgi:hypothetical protein
MMDDRCVAEQPKWIYSDAVFEIKKEIPVYH